MKSLKKINLKRISEILSEKESKNVIGWSGGTGEIRLSCFHKYTGDTGNNNIGVNKYKKSP